MNDVTLHQATPAGTYQEIREEVAKLCAGFPGEYWRKLDETRAYPTEFVQALTTSGYLAALIPEEYGGAGLPLSAAAVILEEVQRQGCNGAACHAQMYIMGTILRRGSMAQKQAYLPQIASGTLRLQAFGVTEPTSGTDTTALRTTARRVGGSGIVMPSSLLGPLSGSGRLAGAEAGAIVCLTGTPMPTPPRLPIMIPSERAILPRH